MRISIAKGDPGYDQSHSRRIDKVTVDGIDQDGVVTADEEQGFVLKLVPDRIKGGFQVGSDGNFLVTRATGKVVVTLKKNASDWDKARKGQAKVAVGREPGTNDILVAVYSLSRPGALKRGRMTASFQDSRSRASLAQSCGVMAGAVAEAICEQWGDQIDPSECARTAVEQAMLMLIEEARGK